MTDVLLKDKLTDRGVLALLVAGLVVLCGAMYIAGYVLTGHKVPRGTTVAGVDIGGLEPAAAETALEKELRPRAQQPIVVTAAGHRGVITPAEAGLAVDYERSVAQAGGGRGWSPGRMWDYFTGGDDLDKVLSVDRDRLGAALDRFARKVDRRPVEGRVRFRDGNVRPRFPKAGEDLDRSSAMHQVTEAFLAHKPGDPVQLEVRETQPDVTAKEVRAAVDGFAKPAMSTPVTLVLRGKDVVIPPETYSRALSMRARHGGLVPHVDEKKLVAAIGSAVDAVAPSPEPATVRLEGGTPKVVPGKDGITFDHPEVTRRFLSLVTQPTGKRALDVKAVVDHPQFTTEDARKLQIKKPVSSFTTYFPDAEYRNINQGRAAELVNGTVLKPGETFSLNGTVGERTAQNGFTKGFMISDGVYKEDYGGGVSQVATTLFNGAFFAGLEDVEHKPHSFYIDRYPVGREATVAWPTVDLKFKNTTPYGVLIQAWVVRSTPSSYGQMHVRMWSTKYWDITAGVSRRYHMTREKTRHLRGKGCVPHQGYGGFDIDVYRYFRRHGSSALVRKETMHTTYTPSDTVVCDGGKSAG